MEPGKNYGWPCYEGPVRHWNYTAEPRCLQEYAKEGTPSADTVPTWSYAHTGGACVIAGPVITNTSYPPDYQGDIIVGDYVQGWLKRITVDAWTR